MVAGPVNIANLGEKRLKMFLDSFDFVFSDCDGVIWVEGKPIPGSKEFFALIKKLGKTVHYVSNNSLKSKEKYEEQFRAVGILDGYENLTIPSLAISEYLKSINFSKHAYCVSGMETIKVLQENGIKCKFGPDIPEEDYADFIKYQDQDKDIGAVVVDSDFRINLAKLYKAFTYLKRPEVFLVNGATDKYVPLGGGELALGTGAFAEMIVTESKKQPILLGKPGKAFGEFAMKKKNVTDPSRVLFMGDMITQDVGLGKATGFQTLLILSSLTKEDMDNHPTLKPDYYAESIQTLVDQLGIFNGKRII